MTRLRAVGELFGDHDSTVNPERPLGALEEVRLQSARIGVASTVAVLLVLLLYALLPGHYPLSRAPFFVLIGVAIVGTIPIALLPWHALTQRGLVLPVLYRGRSSTSPWCPTASTSPAAATPISISSICCSASSWRTSRTPAGDGSP